MFKETYDYENLKKFYIENGLEVSDNILSCDGAIYSISLVKNGEINAAATLSKRRDIFVLDYVAVLPPLRHSGLGKTAVDKILKKAKTLGAAKVYLTAKSRNFFERLGFIYDEELEIDLNSDCKDCPMLNKTCTPRQMIKYI
jgi:N-acetylglutamate synthase-like GNAT family acetyltransferase